MFDFMRKLVGAHPDRGLSAPTSKERNSVQSAVRQFTPKMHEVAPKIRVRLGMLVRSLVSCHDEDGQLARGDIGCITDIGDGALVTVNFTRYSHMYMQLQELTKAPSPCGCVGDTVYSLIDYSPCFKKGSKGTIEGISTDKNAHDRVAVKFGIAPQSFNMLPEMITAAAPAPKAPSRSAFDLGGLDNALESLCTEDISLISHAHGRERRAERNILRRELQAAIKHGVVEKGNPGRDGSPRLRYTYDGVVYITDQTSRHEVTSWRVDGEDAADAVAPAEIELAGRGTHAVLVVDSSGSMRTADVPGFKSRAHAVYECLMRDFAAPQVKTGAAKDVVVSLISMGDNATVLLKTQPLDEALIAKLERIGKRGPKLHGNYIPALDKALEVMTADAANNRASVLLLFFPDGAPSDTSNMECEHGLAVFDFNRKEDPKMGHRSAGSAWTCRKNLHAKVKSECLDRVKRIGQIFGRDKVILRTLAFGPAKEDFTLLNEMADALPRGEFQKLGLNADSLRTAFSSLSSSMSELRTENGGSTLTPRRDKVVNKQQKVEIDVMVHGSKGWWIYAFEHVLAKLTINASGELRQHPVPLEREVDGLAFIEEPFANGVERLVYRCTEVVIPSHKKDTWYYRGMRAERIDLMLAERAGLRLVAKEAKDVENLLKGRRFHEVFACVQQDAAALAMQFNRRQPKPRPDWNVSYLPTTLYCIQVPCSNMYPSGDSWMLVEPELEGKFTKWNDNGGGVRGPPPAAVTGGIGSMALLEEEDEEDEEASCATIDVSEVLQAFSHFSYECSKGKQLVCDLQGVWNPNDGFVLTDPVVHYVSSHGQRHKNGATDKGLEGVKRFFNTHKCNALCAKMKLPVRTADNLIVVPSKR